MSRSPLPFYTDWRIRGKTHTEQTTSGLLRVVDTHTLTERVETLWRVKTGPRASFADLPLAVLDQPLGQILLGGLKKLREDLSGCLTTCWRAHPSCSCPRGRHVSHRLRRQRRLTSDMEREPFYLLFSIHLGLLLLFFFCCSGC